VLRRFLSPTVISGRKIRGNIAVASHSTCPGHDLDAPTISELWLRLLEAYRDSSKGDN
jgi:hypothetical protein